MTTRPKRWLRIAGLTTAAALVLAGMAWAQKCQAKDDMDAGIRFRLQASEKEVGLPVYPGAKPHRDSDGDSPSANLGVWGKAFGLKLVVMKMESGDAPKKVAAFYQKALAKYGKVMDCSDGAKKQDSANGKSSPDALTCDDTPETGETLLKSGTKGKQ